MVYHASVHFNDEQRKKLRDLVVDSNTEQGKILSMVCDWILPTPEAKEALWKDLSNHDSTSSMVDRKIKMECFDQKLHH